MKVSHGLLSGVLLLSSACGLMPAHTSLASDDLAASGRGLTAFRPGFPRVSDERPVTLFSYLPIDDALQAHIPVYLNALEERASNRLYNVAVSDALGPDNTFAWRIVPDGSGQLVSPRATLMPGVREYTTSSPETLARSLAWAYASHPSSFLAFSYLGHGGGYLGLASDQTPGPGELPRTEFMSLAELSSAMRLGLKGRKLDFVHMHACLMANLEAAYELRDLASVLFASEDVVGAWESGTRDVTRNLQELLSAPSLDPRTLGREVVIRAQARRNPAGFATASAIDLDRIEELKRAVNELARSLMAALPRERETILKAYLDVPELKNLEGSGQRDLWRFCRKLASVKDPVVRAKALAVVASLRQVLLHARDQEGEAAEGLSIYMPVPDSWNPGIEASYGTTRFARDTAWDAFITALWGIR
ncbi:MAG: clostripain-related cysteine peptidase [bacterium]|nr:clostripain-related cysteine peptidase [bacterium]